MRDAMLVLEAWECFAAAVVAVPGGGGNRGGAFGQTNPEQQALQSAIEANAPAAQIKELLAKYKAAKAEKQAKLAAAQADLRKVLSVKQEAQATLMGLVE